MPRVATRIVKLVKHAGSFSTDDVVELFVNTKNKSEADMTMLRMMANTLIELVQQGKFDLRKMR